MPEAGSCWEKILGRDSVLWVRRSMHEWKMRISGGDDNHDNFIFHVCTGDPKASPPQCVVSCTRPLTLANMPGQSLPLSQHTHTQHRHGMPNTEIDCDHNSCQVSPSPRLQLLDCSDTIDLVGVRSATLPAATPATTALADPQDGAPTLQKAFFEVSARAGDDNVFVFSCSISVGSLDSTI